MKLSCLFGKHRYAAKNLTAVLLADCGGMGVFLIRDRCVNCGKEYCEQVTIPLPMRGGDIE